MSGATWYDEARVKEKYATVLEAALPALREQNAARRRGAVQNSGLDSGTGPITQKELAEALGAMLGPSGQSVSPRTAMSISAVYGCVSLLAGAISSLPIHQYRRTGDERERVMSDVWWLLNEEPYPTMSAAVFWEFMSAAYFLHGDMFAEIRRPAFRSAGVESLLPINPDHVLVSRLDDGDLVYDVRTTDDGIGPRRVLAADMIHVPAMGFDGKRGMSPVRYAGTRAMRIAMAADEYSEAFFGNGASPNLALKVPGNLSKDQLDVIRATFESRHSGSRNAFKTVMLTGGIEVEKLTMTAEDAALIATRQFQVEDICRIYGVPPFMVGHTDKTTSFGSGVENMGRGFLKFTLQRHLVKIEQELNRKLWPTRTTNFLEFSVSGLERGDTKTRNESYRVALGRAGEPGWMTVNEVRRMENLAPVEGGDQLNQGVPRETSNPAAA